MATQEDVSVLVPEFHQYGYVTRDIQAKKEWYTKNMGLGPWRELEWNSDNARIEEVKGTLRLLEPSDSAELPQWVPVVDETRCSDCDICVRACVDGAISLVGGTARIDEELCEGCRTCYYVCPKGAITLTPGA